MKTKKKNRKKIAKTNRRLPVVERRDDDIAAYIAKDNGKLNLYLGLVTHRMDVHNIEAVFSFKDARFEDKWNHKVSRLVSCGLGNSEAIRRLEFLVSRRMPSEYDGVPVGSTGTPTGDLDKLLELIANNAYAIGVLQGAKLEGAPESRLDEIISFARL